MNFDSLFRPKSMAIVGVSDKHGMGRGAAEGALQSSIEKRVYFINIKRDEVLGRRCYHSLSELPEVVETVILCVNANLINSYLEEAGRLGVKAAIVYASGFSEDGTERGRELENDMKQICNRYGMLLCGPNCVGLYNKVDRISCYATAPLFPEKNLERGIGAVAHSGYINSNLMRSMPELCAYGVSVGNGTICTLEQYMLYYALNEHVSCIAAYVEGIKDVHIFEQALRTAAEKHKPVVLLKSGRSAKGSVAAASHTGNLAGDYKTFEAVLKRFGVVICDSLEELNSTARMFAILDGRLPKGRSIGAVNFSGGENTICADFCEKYGLELPAYSPDTHDVVKSLIPMFSTARNPLDPTTEMFSEHDKVKAMFTAIAKDTALDMFVLGLELTQELETKDKTCLEVLEEMAAEHMLIPSFLIPSFEKTRNTEAVQRMQAVGIPMLAVGDLGYKMLRNLSDFVSFRPEEHTLSLAIPEYTHSGAVALSEMDSKLEINATGIPIPKQAAAANIEELCEKLNSFEYPIVLKVDSPDILHKTEAGGVVMNITTESDAVEAFQHIMSSCRSFKSDAKINGVLAQEMIPRGIEIIIGIKNDIQYGPMILCGLGGVFVEVFRDVALSPCPVSLNEAKKMLSGLKAYKLLTGYRGAIPKDVDALAQAMVAVSKYAAKNKDSVAEIDLNPVFVYDAGQGVKAADALIVKFDSQ